MRFGMCVTMSSEMKISFEWILKVAKRIFNDVNNELIGAMKCKGIVNVRKMQEEF